MPRTIQYTVYIVLGDEGTIDKKHIRESLVDAITYAYQEGALTPNDEDHAALLSCTVEDK